ncbi:MAG: hypothetical protein ACRCZF_18505 [Gemmataceae bacterium]
MVAETELSRRESLFAGAAMILGGGTPRPLAPAPRPVAPPPVADIVLRAPAGPSAIVLTTTRRLAGAVHSITWNGVEFIDSVDHGRQLQSASSFDRLPLTDFWAETYNPTEAGSRGDHIGPTSTSLLHASRFTATELHTTSQMAYWLAPGERSAKRLARNTTRLSEHYLSKRIQLGHAGDPHILEYDVTFRVPVRPEYQYGQLELLTGYMPAAFERFWAFDPATGQLGMLSDGPGEQKLPVVLSRADGRHAMGAFTVPPTEPDYSPIGYGRFRFRAEKCVKWNCVSRVRNRAGVGGKHSFRMFVAVGDLDTVRRCLVKLHEEFPKNG